MKTFKKKFNKIFDYFKVEDKIKEIFNKAPFPKVKNRRRFVRLIIDYIFGAIFNYQCSANVIFDNDNDKKVFYNLIKQDKYDFSSLLTEQGYQVLDDYLEKHKNHNSYNSWCTNNRITLVVDKMECPRTSGNHEKSKKLYKSKNGHYLINLAFVIGDNREFYDLNSVLYDPDCGKTSVMVAFEMLIECIRFIHSSGVDMNRIRFSADREFIADYIIDYCKQNKLRFITRTKKNTVLYYSDFKFNANWLKDYLFNFALEDFITSSQLDSWSNRNNKPQYKYWTKILQSNFGQVRVVAVVDRNKELTDKNYNRHIHILIGFDCIMNSVQIIEAYKGQRWQIEVFHRSWKQDIEVVKSYMGTSFIGLQNHYILRALSYLYLAKYRSNKRTWKKTIGQNKRMLSMLYWSSNFL